MNMKKFWAGIAIFALSIFTLGTVLFYLKKPEQTPPPIRAPQLPSQTILQAVSAPSPEKSLPAFVESLDSSIKFEDFPYAGENERSSYRQFTLPIKEHDPIVLIAANLVDELWRGDRDNNVALISRLFDLDAAFIPVANYELQATGDWKQVTAYIGGFAQDGCGGVDLVYVMKTQNIVAVFTANPKDVDFFQSGCPLEQNDFKSSIGKQIEAKDEMENFCSYRTKCLQDYYAPNDHRATFAPDWLKQVTAVAFRVPAELTTTSTSDR